MNNIATFNFQGKAPVRTILIEGEPWFVASDVASVLGYVNPQKAIRDHCKGVNETGTPSAGGIQTVKIIRESDVYRLVMRSKLPTAEAFEAWVVEEVLPSIRKTGSYQVQAFQVPKTFAEALALAADQAKTLETQAQEIATLEPKAEYHDKVADANGCHTMAEAAQILGTGQNRLYIALRYLGYIIPNSTRPYQTYVNDGLFKVVEKVFEDAHGIDRLSSKTLVTGKGMVSIEKRLRANGLMIGPKFVGVAS